MGNKTKKHGKQSANDIFQYARRAMEKEDFKEALKNAKVCFRQDPSQEHRQLLERSWLARGLQLAHAGLQAEGRAAAQELLAMGVSEPDVKNGLPELLLAVGLYDLAVATGKIGGNGQAADPTILAHAADRAVIDPASAPASLPGIREGATRVRAALDALYGGDESAATAALGDVPRNSPFAAWKLFIRGLAAYYRQDDEAMRANWDRLDANRFAARLAVLLRRLADPACNSGDSASETRGQDEFRQAIRVLEKDLVGGPAVWYLESLQQSLRDRHWREAVTALRRWRKEFQTILPTLTQRLERFFYDMAVRRANRKWLTDLTTAIDPPRWDPRWNRARALISEAEEAGIETAENFWLVYLDDLATLPDLKPAERPLAQAMIWARIGGRWANEADHIEDEDEDYDDYEDDDYEDDDYEDDDEDDDEPDLNAMRRRGRRPSSASTRRLAWRRISRKRTMRSRSTVPTGNKRMPQRKPIDGYWQTSLTTSTRSSLCSTTTAVATRVWRPATMPCRLSASNRRAKESTISWSPGASWRLAAWPSRVDTKKHAPSWLLLMSLVPARLLRPTS